MSNSLGEIPKLVVLFKFWCSILMRSRKSDNWPLHTSLQVGLKDTRVSFFIDADYLVRVDLQDEIVANNGPWRVIDSSWSGQVPRWMSREYLSTWGSEALQDDPTPTRYTLFSSPFRSSIASCQTGACVIRHPRFSWRCISRSLIITHISTGWTI